jgi:hypothetical protein
MTVKFILDGHTPRPESDFIKWAKWFESADRIVKKTRLEVSISGLLQKEKKLGFVEISTVFLGLDHNFFGKGPPVLFETMVFGGELDEETERCSTWEQAEEMHQRMINKVKALGEK